MTEPAAAVRPAPPRAFRWLVLVFISLAMFGNYYVYDSISPLADVLKARLGFTDTNIGLLQAIYSVPNIFMVLVGGIVVDRIGVRRATLAFGAACLAGAAVTASAPSLAVMAAGRLIFGLGAESLIVAVTTAIAKWFKGKELSFAFGVNLTIARLGSFAALNSPSWAGWAYGDWRPPLLVATGFATFCVTGALLYWALESRAARQYSLGAAGSADTIVFRDLLRFGWSYALIVALCVTFYSGIFPFQTFAVKFFMEAHGASRETGGFLSSMLTLFAMICTPLFGFVVDKVGRRSLFMMGGALLLVPAYLMMAYTSVSLYVPMAMMGTAFSLIPAIMWPSVAYVVEETRLGTAYGLMTLVQNIGLAGFNLVIGWANDAAGASAANPAGYRPGMWIFSTLGVSAVVCSLLLWRREHGPHAHGLETIRAA
ncbi:MAG TPA: MFS transporter [Vicinamibacterales bacterium]|nr:MFS transporter [Vicinamibacterales bacterium]